MVGTRRAPRTSCEQSKPPLAAGARRRGHRIGPRDGRDHQPLRLVCLRPRQPRREGLANHRLRRRCIEATRQRNQGATGGPSTSGDRQARSGRQHRDDVDAGDRSTGESSSRGAAATGGDPTENRTSNTKPRRHHFTGGTTIAETNMDHLQLQQSRQADTQTRQGVMLRPLPPHRSLQAPKPRPGLFPPRCR